MALSTPKDAFKHGVYDLTSRFAPFYDQHLVLPLIEFLENKGLYKQEDMLKAQMSLLKHTKMIDRKIEIQTELNQINGGGEDSLAALVAEKEEIGQEMDDLKETAGPMLELIGDVESSDGEDQHQKFHQLVQDQNFTESYLRDQMNFSDESLDAFSKLARFMYDIGQYDVAQKYLEHYAMLVSSPVVGGGLGAGARETPKVFAVMWGKLACELLQNTQYAKAHEDILKLKEYIDGQLFLKPLELLQQRAWLMHWCLFLVFFHPESYDSMIEILYSQKYVEAMQTCCPWLIRYLSAAFVLHHQGQRRNNLKELIRLLRQEKYAYIDPLTEFVECIHVTYDFEEAQKKLVECLTVMEHDFFLQYSKDEFLEHARMMIFETYCRLHQTIDIAMLSDKLSMTQEDSEKWIVDLIRGAQFDAKIDSKENHVIMSKQFPSIYQEIINKTKDLGAKSAGLSQNIDRYRKGESLQVRSGGGNRY